MIDREEAKKRMKVKFESYCEQNALLKALLNSDVVMIAKFKDLDARIDKYNAKVDSDIDAASDPEFEQMIKVWQRPSFKMN